MPDKISDIINSMVSCELISAVLWAVKKYILLTWKAHTVYNRSNEELLRKCTHWYCLHSLWRGSNEKEKLLADSSVTAGQAADSSVTTGENPLARSLFAHLHSCSSDCALCKVVCSTICCLKGIILVNVGQEYQEAKTKKKEKKWKAAKEALESVKLPEEEIQASTEARKLSIHEKDRTISAFLSIDRGSLPKESDIPNMCKKWWDKYNTHKDDPRPDQHQYKRETSKRKESEGRQSTPNQSTEDQKDDRQIKWKISMHDESAEGGQPVSEQSNEDQKDDLKTAKAVFKKLQETETVKSIQDLQRWMDKAMHSCRQLHYFLTAAQDIMNFLNWIMIAFMIALVIVILLLLAKILTTKLVVYIASPILAATFIFGETLKIMFQGIVFAYVMHPFTVGDLLLYRNTTKI